MIKKIKHIFSHSVYRRTFYVYAISIVLIIIIILLCVFGVVSSEIKEQARDASQQQLSQLAGSTNRAYGDIVNLMSVISSDSKALRVFQNTARDKGDEYRLFLRLQSLGAYYSYIENIAVLKLDNDTCVQSMGSNEFITETMAVVREMVESGKYILSRDIHTVSKKKNVISFLQYFPAYEGCILIDVNSNLFQYSLSEESEDARVVYIIDMEGNPVTTITQGKLDEDTLIADYLFRAVSWGGKECTSIVYDDKVKQQMVCMIRSENLDWWFCDILSYSYFFKEYRKFSAVLIGVTGLFLLVSIVTLVLFSKKMQKGLLKIANRCRNIAGMDELPTGDELEYIDKTMSRISHEKYMNENYINSWFLKSLISGQEIPFLLSKEKVMSLQEKYKAPHYVVLLIRIQPKEEIPEERKKEEYGIYRFTVCNLADEIFGESYRCKAVELEEDTVAVLLLIDTRELSEEYLLCYNWLREFAENNIGLLLSGSLGCVVESQNEIYLSCEKARQYMKVTNLTGKKELIDSNNISNVNYQVKNQKLVEAIIEYTALNYANPDLSLKSIAQMFHLSTAYVGKIFKVVQGCSYASYLVNFRLEESKVLLLETKKTVNEIAGELGFTNATYFTTLFKNVYGMTPTTFRHKG